MCTVNESHFMKMAAIVSTHDIEIEETDEINVNELAYDEYENCEIELDDINWDDIDDFDESLITSVQIAFVDETNVENISSSSNQTSSKQEEKQPLQCNHCNRKYKRKAYFEKHQKKCGNINHGENTTGEQSSGHEVTTQVPATSETKGALNISEDDVKSKAAEIVKESLDSVIKNPIYSIKIGSIVSFGNIIKQIAEHIYGQSETEPFRISAISLVNEIYKILCKPDNLLNEKNLQTVMSNLHKLTLNQKAKDVWISTAGDKVQTPQFSSLFQKLCTIIMHKLIEMENKSQSVNEKAQEYHLYPQEQEVVRYVAGYIVFSLRRKYFKLSKSNVQSTRVAAVAVLQFLKNLETKTESSQDSMTFLEYTKKWIELRNHGGLITVNDNMFLFIRIVENTVRNVLTLSFLKSYRGEDLRDVIVIKINENQLVVKYWEKLCRNMDNERLKELLKSQFINKWIDIRARAYVNAYVQMVKRVCNKQTEKSKLSKAAEPALRKTIS